MGPRPRTCSAPRGRVGPRHARVRTWPDLDVSASCCARGGPPDTQTRRNPHRHGQVLCQNPSCLAPMPAPGLLQGRMHSDSTVDCCLKACSQSRRNCTARRRDTQAQRLQTAVAGARLSASPEPGRRDQSKAGADGRSVGGLDGIPERPGIDCCQPRPVPQRLRTGRQRFNWERRRHGSRQATPASRSDDEPGALGCAARRRLRAEPRRT